MPDTLAQMGVVTGGPDEARRNWAAEEAKEQARVDARVSDAECREFRTYNERRIERMERLERTLDAIEKHEQETA